MGSDPARIDNSICPRPGSTVPGSEIAAHDKPSRRKLGWVERRKARVSLSGGRDALRSRGDA